jgi:hypothetical protein
MQWIGWGALAIVLVFALPFWVEDRLEEAYHPHWWTSALGYAARYVAIGIVAVIYFRRKDRQRRRTPRI